MPSFMGRRREEGGVWKWWLEVMAGGGVDRVGVYIGRTIRLSPPLSSLLSPLSSLPRLSKMDAVVVVIVVVVIVARNL